MLKHQRNESQQFDLVKVRVRVRVRVMVRVRVRVRDTYGFRHEFDLGSELS